MKVPETIKNLTLNECISFMHSFGLESNLPSSPLDDMTQVGPVYTCSYIFNEKNSTEAKKLYDLFESEKAIKETPIIGVSIFFGGIFYSVTVRLYRPNPIENELITSAGGRPSDYECVITSANPSISMFTLAGIQEIVYCLCCKYLIDWDSDDFKGLLITNQLI